MKNKLQQNPFFFLFLRFLKDNSLYYSIKKKEYGKKNIYPIDMLKLCHLPETKRMEIEPKWQATIQPFLEEINQKLFKEFINRTYRRKAFFNEYLHVTGLSNIDAFFRAKKSWWYPMTSIYNDKLYSFSSYDIYDIDATWSYNQRQFFYNFLKNETPTVN